METETTLGKLHEIAVQIAASQQDVLQLTTKIRDNRLVYRPITKDDGHWGPVTEQRTLRTTTIDFLTGEILGEDSPCILGESCQCGSDDCCECNGDRIANACICTPCPICGLCEHVCECDRRTCGCQLAAVYPRLYHMADAESWESIRQHGLLSTSSLLDLFEVTTEERAPIGCRRRPDSVSLKHINHGRAVVRDQKRLIESNLRKSLEGCTVEEWHRLLNKHVFFWLTKERLQTLLCARALGGRWSPQGKL